MAGSTFYGTTNNQYITPKIVWSSTPNIVGNYSTVTATLYVSRNNTGYTTSGTWSGGISIDSNTATATKSVSISYNSNTMMVSNTFNVSHGNDGVGYVNISAYGRISGTSYNETYISGQFQLDTIPRTSPFSLSSTNFTIGNNITVSINPASSSFNHRIYMEFGDMVTLATGIGSSYVWNTGNNESTFYKYMPTDVYSFGAVHVDTYSGSTFIGRNSIRFQVNVPSSVVPIINSVTITQATTSIQTKFGGYVQNKSTANVVTASSGAKGSSITLTSVKVGSLNYTGSNITTGILASSGTNTFNISVTDSRGRTTSSTRSITVLPYSNPNISSFSVQRCTSDGILNDEGTYAKVIANGSVSSVNNNNTRACRVKYKEKTSSTWTTIDITMSSYTLTINGVYCNGALSSNKSYDFLLELSDYFTTGTATTNIGTATPTIDFKNGGKGIAIGKVAELDNYLDINWDTRVLGNVLQTEKIIYHPSNGVLVDLLPATTLTQMITIEVTGNGYGLFAPINTIIQGYHYTPQGTIQNCAQLNLGADLSMAKFMIHNGRLKVWFTQPSAYNTIKVKAYTQNIPLNYINVTNEAEPAGTNKVTCAKAISRLDLYNSVKVETTNAKVPYNAVVLDGNISKCNNYVTLEHLIFRYYQVNVNGFTNGSVVGIVPLNFRPKSRVRLMGIVGRTGYPASYEMAFVEPSGEIVVVLYSDRTAFENISLANSTYYVG